MIWYKHKRCANCRKEFHEKLRSRKDTGKRTLCDFCEAEQFDSGVSLPAFEVMGYSAPSNMNRVFPAKRPPQPVTYLEPLDPRYQDIRKSHFLRSAHANNSRARIRGVEGDLLAEELLEIYNRQQGLCQYCKQRLTPDWEADHIIPISKGGPNLASNIAIACARCNSQKKDRTPEQWRDAKAKPSNFA